MKRQVRRRPRNCNGSQRHWAIGLREGEPSWPASPHSRFVAPVHEGDMVDIRADILKRGRSSIHVAVDLWAENLLTGNQRHPGAADLVMVAVDERGKPQPISIPPN